MSDYLIPALTFMSSATILTAISAGVSAPISIPTGAWTLERSSWVKPYSRSFSYRIFLFRRLPIIPMYLASVFRDWVNTVLSCMLSLIHI